MNVPIIFKGILCEIEEGAKIKSVDWGVPAKNLCSKIAPTLVQNRGPDWDSRNVRSRFDVTALTLPRFPMRGREPLETRF